MPSRRRLLARAGAGALAAVAGCSAPRESGGPSAVCSASLSGGDVAFSLTPQVTPTGSAGDGAAPGLAVLVVPIRQATIEAENLDLVQVFDGDGVRYRIPLSADDDPVGETRRYDADDVVEYAQSLGHVPQNGRFRLVALDADGEQVDEVRIDFRCYRPVDEG